MATREMDIIKQSAGGLSKAEKIQLIEFLNKSLKEAKSNPTQVRFGKYRDSGGPASKVDDFKLPGWNGK